ncbi:hypothetical protein [Phascolarctobacterium faecium]|mgnify:FL=1|jgi:hypothetical protein|uniref:hypothetical protein n=1 Tax=Phascolarctobacterium faecium TaxID=33025 RepID=UPI000E4816F2|nr:hypothetical protein DWY17_02340 [Butyricicoccus sp. AF24-19AC]RHQ82934.1 hypothetical protein DWX95_05695 [Butyricicoccus sp. AF22-28AC]
MQMSIGLDRLKRFVCLLLIFVLLFCFFMCPRASAVALEASTVAYAGLLVGTLLVGAGVAFSNPGDMAKAGNAMYRTLQKGNEAIASKIAAISVWAVEHGKAIGSAALRIGKDLYQGIVDTFNAAYSGGKLAISDNVTALTVDNAEAACNYISHQFLDSVSFVSGDDVVSLSVTLDGNYLYVYRYVNGVYVDKSGGLSGSYLHKGIYLYADGAKIKYCLGHSNADISTSDHVPNYGYFEYAVSVPCRISTVCNIPDSIALPKPDLVYPSDNNLVRLPDIPSVDTDTGEVTYPDSIAYTKDAVAAPYPIGDDGVKVPDIPFDVPVDQTSGKPMDDTGTDTDNPSKPGEGTDTDKPSVNWPSAGDISLPKLIISKFPFCIPFDVARLIGLLEADPKTPIFHVPLKVGTILDEEIVLDLSQWDNAVRIIRWGELIVFVAGLVLVTRNYIKW